jgi:hypothetical protein
LSDGRADPLARGSEALVLAAKNNFPDILQLLLQDGRARPDDSDSDAYSWAMLFKHDQILDLLVFDGRVDGSRLDYAEMTRRWEEEKERNERKRNKYLREAQSDASSIDEDDDYM